MFIGYTCLLLLGFKFVFGCFAFCYVGLFSGFVFAQDGWHFMLSFALLLITFEGGLFVARCVCLIVYCCSLLGCLTSHVLFVRLVLRVVFWGFIIDLFPVCWVFVGLFVCLLRLMVVCGYEVCFCCCWFYCVT